MIIFNLIISNNEKAAAVVDSILKNRFALNVVVGHAEDSYHLNSAHATVPTKVYVIQFVTKSMLFSEIESSLKKEFPQTDFYSYATPIVHMAINLHDKIKKRVIGLNLMEKETEN